MKINYKILVVDDSAQVRKTVRRFLESDRDHTFLIEEAHHGKHALEMLSKHSFDMMLSDLEMPEMNGLELIAVVRKDPRYKDLPILFLTGVVDTQKKVEAFETLATDYITKPFIAAELKARILAHLERKNVADTAKLKALKSTRIALFYRNLDSLEIVKLENSIVQLSQWVLHIKDADLWILDKVTGALRLSASTYTVAIDISINPENSSIMRQVLKTEKPFIYSLDTSKSVETEEAITDNIAVLLPLTFDKVPLGILSYNRFPENFFQLYDLNDLEAIQRYITNVLYNAYLYHDLKTTKIQLAETEKIAGMTKTFEKFVPKPFLDRIASEGLENIELGKAHDETIAILFADIRSFTSLAETMTSQETLNFLNSYFKRMTLPIQKQNGFIDKFIGDAIMALFAESEVNAQKAQRAVNAAIGMQNALVLYNIHRKNSGYIPVSVGIGVHIDSATIGTVGTEYRMDSTVLGDAINLASRLEGLTKIYQCHTIISAQTFDLLEDTSGILYRELDIVNVKGKSKPVRIIDIFNSGSEEIRDLKLKSLNDFQEGVTRFRNREWEESSKLFEQCLRIFPADITAKMYIKRADLYKSAPPPSDWNGVNQIDTK
ncbi:adenylate/guanylate cyclase domain-containing protein [Deltaproteobacteria bacterium TL4]